MSQLSIKAFLSHRYKSPDVNLYFFGIFNEVAEVQFEVDEGHSDTNVTRLERMIRDSDAFIGIYPFSGTPDDARNPEILKSQSKYFRLEIDLAIRSRKPAVIFYDRRYGNLLKPPSSVFSYPFEINEITGAGGFPDRGKHKRIVQSFFETVELQKKYAESVLTGEKNNITLIVPPLTDDTGGYTDQCVDNLRNILKKSNFTDLTVLRWPFSLNNETFRIFENTDIAIVDFGKKTVTSGVPAYLHGRFIPSVRMKYISGVYVSGSINSDDFLFGSVEVGYKKDMILWTDYNILNQEFSKRIEAVAADVRRIST